MPSFLDDMHVFHTGKRNPPYQHWEPIYIGTHQDPLYDERLSWEGRSDKMTQVKTLFIYYLNAIHVVTYITGNKKSSILTPKIIYS